MSNFFESSWDIIIKIWNFTLINIQNDPITVKKTVIAAAVIFLGFYVSKILRAWIRNSLHKKDKFSENAIHTIEMLTFYFALITSVFIALGILRIPLTTFTFLGGALAVGVGFGAQNVLNNFISGFIIMTERPVKKGDVVNIDGNIGTIERIGARCTMILTSENIHKLVPNSMIIEKLVTNWTLKNAQVRSCISVGIAYESDIHKATNVMLEAMKKCEGVLDSPEPFVVFKAHGSSTLNFELYFWCEISNPTEKMLIESSVNYAANDALRAADIEIAFPQLDLHVKKAPLPEV